MNIAIEEAQKALLKGNVPVGCVIVKNNEIIAKAHNDQFWHAEIICIHKAYKKFKKNLKDSIIFSTLEPCSMCEHAINLCRIKTIICGTKSNIKEIKKAEKFFNIKQGHCNELLKNYFKNKRNK